MNARRPAVFLVIASAAATAWFPVDARACSSLGPVPHVLDPAMQATDQAAPTLPPLDVPRITRGKAAERSGCGYSQSSCDDLGGVAIAVRATDDQTPPAQIGYRMTLAGGSLPSGLSLPGAVKASGDVVGLTWVDGATDDQEPIDFTLRVVAIDLAGNESAPQMVRVSDGAGGCAVAPARAAHGGPAFVAVAALLLAARRRRRSEPLAETLADQQV